jgi:hypothetical protein
MHIDTYKETRYAPYEKALYIITAVLNVLIRRIVEIIFFTITVLPHT